MLLPLGIAFLQPLLDTNEQRVITDTDATQWKQNLLHAAVALQLPEQRAEAVAAITAKAAQQGWVAVFSAKSGRQQTPATMCKNTKVRQAILAAEVEAKQVAAKAAAAAKAAKEAEAAAAAAAAKVEAGGTEREQQQQQVGGAAGDSSSAAAGGADAAVASSKGSNGQGGQAGQQQQGAGSAAAANGATGPETAKQRRERLHGLVTQVARALQLAAAPAVLDASEQQQQQQQQQQQRLSAAQKAARDVVLVRSRIAGLAPEQLPEKDVALGEGVIPGAEGDAAAAASEGSKRSRRHGGAAADGAVSRLQQELQDEDADDVISSEDYLDDEAGSTTVGGTAAGSTAAGSTVLSAADAAELASVNEDSLSGLPWEFIITREALNEGMHLEE
jgi:hypothetical protein